MYCYYLPGKSLPYWIEHLCSFKTRLPEPCSRFWPLCNSASLKRVIPTSCLRCHAHFALCYRETGNSVSMSLHCFLCRCVVWFQLKLQTIQCGVESIGLGMLQIPRSWDAARWNISSSTDRLEVTWNWSLSFLIWLFWRLNSKGKQWKKILRDLETSITGAKASGALASAFWKLLHVICHLQLMLRPTDKTLR